MQSKFDKIPDELILTHVFPNLSPLDLINVSFTCHRFRDIATNKNLPQRYFTISNQNLIESQFKKKKIVLNSLYCRENLLFGFNNQRIYIWEKNNNEKQLNFKGEIKYNINSSNLENYKIEAGGILSPIFDNPEKNEFTFICSSENRYYQGRIISNQSTLKAINLPNNTSSFAIAKSLIFYGKLSGQIEILDTEMEINFILSGHQKTVLAMTVSKDKLYSICQDKIIIWDIDNQRAEKIIKNDLRNQNNLHLSIERNSLLAYSKEYENICSVEIIDLATEKATLKLSPPKGWSSCNLVGDNLLISMHACDHLISIKLESLRTLQNIISEQENSMPFSHFKCLNI